MSYIVLFGRLKARQLRGVVRSFGEHSKLKVFVLSCFAVIFWLGMFGLFRWGLRFIDRMVAADLSLLIVTYLFSLFFFSLLVMLTFSNGIIGYTAVFRNRETAWLLTQPLPPVAIYAYKLVESLVFSSWAFGFIGAPIIVAYGVNAGVPWSYYPAVLLLFCPFVLLPAALGNVIALLLVRYMPRRRRSGIAAGLLAVLAIGAWQAWRALSSVSAGHGLFSSLGLYQVLSRLQFLQNPLLPSHWIAEGLLRAGDGELAAVGFYFGVLAANGLLWTYLGLELAHAVMPEAYNLAHSQGSRKRRVGQRGVRRLLDGVAFFLPVKTRVFLEKDIKTFFRDPVQWSQFLLLVGLLAFYILNLRTLNYDGRSLFWKNLIAFLNLGATALTMTTFSSRFVFPLLSLEGRRFWVLGVSPVPKRQILMGKFWFSLFGLLLVSETLIVISCYMLAVPRPMALMHCAAMIVICFGISGLAVGLGAMYPNFREDNPSKIVAGFGGTLNLVLSLIFILLVIVLLAPSSHLYFVRGRVSPLWVALPLCAAAVLALAVCLVPLRMGLSSFRKLEF